MPGLDAQVLGLHLLSRSTAAAAAIASALLATSAFGATPSDPGARPWLDAPLGYLLRTGDELGVDVALLLRVVGQLTGDSRASEVAEIRRLGFTDHEIGRLAPLFTLELPVLAAAGPTIEPLPPPSLPPAPSPADRQTLDGRRANAATCLDRAAACELGPGCTDWATDPRFVGLELTHQAAWLLFVRWRRCPVEIELEDLQIRLAGRLLGELVNDHDYSETHLERVATLGHLGYGDRTEADWVRTVLAARSPAGCWGAKPGGPCHPHPTALALWALALAERSGAWKP